MDLMRVSRFLTSERGVLPSIRSSLTGRVTIDSNFRRTSLEPLYIIELPRTVEISLRRPIESKIRKPSFTRKSLDPIACWLPFGCTRPKV